MRCVDSTAKAGALIVLLAWASGAQAQYLYWSSADGVERVALDGQNRAMIAASEELAYGLTYDPAGRELYWIADDSLLKSGLGGENVTQIVDLTGQFAFATWAVALDSRGRLSNGQPRLYFSSDNEIYAANLDGSDLERVIAFGNDDPEVYSIAIDFDEHRFFWSIASS